MVEHGRGHFADLTKKAIKRGSFPSIDTVVDAILAYLDPRNLDPTPFVGTATVEEILAKLRDGKAVIETFH